MATSTEDSIENTQKETDQIIKEIDQAFKKFDSVITKRVKSINRKANKFKLPKRTTQTLVKGILEGLLGNSRNNSSDDAEESNSATRTNLGLNTPSKSGSLKTSNSQFIADLAVAIFKSNQRNL